MNTLQKVSDSTNEIRLWDFCVWKFYSKQTEKNTAAVWMTAHETSGARDHEMLLLTTGPSRWEGDLEGLCAKAGPPLVSDCIAQGIVLLSV